MQNFSLSIHVGRKETMANIGLALALAILYYFAAIILPGWLKDFPHLKPHLLIWIPNLLYIALGYKFFAKLNKH